MNKIETGIPEVFLIEPDVFGDDRGYFMETWRKEWFETIKNLGEFVQDNQSKSVKGTLRGLHYQTKQPQGKYIRALSGKIYDVVVDLRKASPSFGQWVGEILSDKNRRSLWVPPGFAHGFYVVSDEAEIAYKCTDYYAPKYEKTLMWNDPQLDIDWPLVNGEVLLSAKDQEGQLFSDCEYYP